MWWYDLSDDELRAKLEARGTAEPTIAELVADREENDVVIASILDRP